MINRESSDNSTTDKKTDSDTNPDGCTYVDYDIRNTGYQWRCDAGHYHTTAHFIVCKEGNKYYAKKGYYVLKGWKGNKSPTLMPEDMLMVLIKFLIRALRLSTTIANLHIVLSHL